MIQEVIQKEFPHGLTDTALAVSIPRNGGGSAGAGEASVALGELEGRTWFKRKALAMTTKRCLSVRCT